ncbi:MAG: transglycosylase SLT domain-containing protein [Gammaproteobacteria bacterium]|jgi:hypothetical protein
MSFQEALETIRQHTFPKRRALERELAEARAENQAVSAELANTRKEFEQTHHDDTRKNAELLQKISSIEYEHSAARHQVHVLKTSLEEAEARQQQTEQQINALESRLEEERSRYESSRQQAHTLETSLEEAALRQQENARQISALESKLEAEHRQYENSQHHVQSLESSLEEASRRLQETGQQIGTLESRLEEERDRHSASLSMTQESLARLLAEQQNLMTLQSDLARTFHEGNSRLVQSIQAAGIKPRPSNFQMATVAGLLFLTGALAGLVMDRGAQQSSVDLSGVTSGIEELQLIMQEHFTEREQMMKILREALDRGTASAIVPQTQQAPSRTLAPQGGEQQAPGKPDPAATTGIMQPESGLMMPGESPARPLSPPEYDPAVALLQEDLMTLGFDLGSRRADGIRGARTEQALEEFRRLYFPAGRLQEGPDTEKLAAVLGKYAGLAREDEKKFHIDSGVLAAIRLGNFRTGVEFSFLMELAAIESSFNPAARARTSTAAGLYQFKRETWLDTVKQYGRRYGLGEYARQVEYVVDDKGNRQPVIRNAAVQQEVLDLRFNPMFSALLAAENVKRNMRQLTHSFDREPGRTELYLTHFFGAAGAISFLKALEKHPDRIAGEIFPGPAKRNKNIFRMQTRKPRTVAEVYEVFSRKFNTARYEVAGQG